jgi:hypothetical protein
LLLNGHTDTIPIGASQTPSLDGDWIIGRGAEDMKGGLGSDETGSNVTSRATSMGDVFATIYKAFGIDWTKEYDTQIGRPIKIANSYDDGTAEPIRELV